MKTSIDVYPPKTLQQRLLKAALFLFFITAGTSAYAVDWLAPIKGLKGLFSHNDTIVVWQAPGQYIKIVDQDWDRDHRRAPKNDQPATISAPHLAVVLVSLRAWRPEDSPETDNSVRLFTDDEIALLAPKLADALGRAGPKQDVVFAVTGNYDNFMSDRRRTTAARVFMYNGKLNMIFGDVLRPVGDENPDDDSEYSEPHRAGRRIESNGSDIVVSNGIGIDHYTYFETPRLDWIQVDVPAVVAAYHGPEMVKPVPVASEEIQTDGALSKENRKLREELARMRKEEGETQAPVPTAMAQQPRPVTVSPPVPHPYTTPSTPVKAATGGGNVTSSAKVETQADLDSIQKRLQLLKELHDKGLITDQEYNAKRKEIVEQI